MPRNRETAVQTKVVQVAFGLVLLGIVVFATKSMMFGSTMIAKILAVAIVGVTVVFALDKRYWLLSAFLFGFYDTIPYIKFTGAELGALILVSVFFVRMSLMRDRHVGGTKAIVLSVIPFLSWMCVVWAMNPVGMFIFGSSSIGGRFYFKVILAFLSMCCLSTLELDEREAKYLALAVVFGYLARAFFFVVFGDTEKAFFGTRSHYAFIPVTYATPIFLCRFSAPELLSRVGPFVGFSILFLLGFWAGNRTGASRPVLVGLLAPVFLRKDRIKTFFLFLAASLVLFIAVLGHGSAWRLPFAAQRALSFLPGKWDRRLEAYGFHDNFRATLRMYAREHIKENPWFGDGGFSLDFGDMAWTNSNRDQDSINMHVLSRNWHNVWLGMAADFGIPLSVAWALFMAVLLVSGWREARRMPLGTWHQTAFLYFYLLIVVEFISFFFAGGHTAYTAEQIFLWAGMMLAVRNGVPPTLTVSAMPMIEQWNRR